MADLYAQDGVNFELGDDFSTTAANLFRDTWTACPLIEVKDFSDGYFRGPRGFRPKLFPDHWYLDSPMDGIGTKVGFHAEGLSPQQGANDLLAMCCGDIDRFGGVPVVFNDLLDVSTLGEKDGLVYLGYIAALKQLRQRAIEQKIVVFRGETAELGPYVGSENPDAQFKFNWAGCAVGLYDQTRMIVGRDVRPGDAVVALRQRKGFRSNGLSTVRKAFRLRFGERWWEHADAYEAIKDAAAPSTLYSRFLSTANGWYNGMYEAVIPVKQISHLSGGGIPAKFGKDFLFKHGFSAVLPDLWELPDIIQAVVDWGVLTTTEGLWTDRDSYNVWGCGQGVLVVLDKSYVDEFIRLARRADHNIEAKVCGKITRPGKEGPKLSLRSKFSGKWVHYVPQPK